MTGHRTDAPTYDWTEERVAELKRLWAMGYSARQVASAIGHPSRSAVIGKLRRLKLQGEGRGAPSKPARISKPKLSGVQRRKLARPNNFVAVNLHQKELRAQAKVFGETKVEPAITHAPRATTKADAFAPLPGSTPIPWTERGVGCAWPADVPEADEQHSCGLETGGATYCAAHLAMRTQPPAPGKPKRSPNELMRALRRYAA